MARRGLRLTAADGGVFGYAVPASTDPGWPKARGPVVGHPPRVDDKTKAGYWKWERRRIYACGSALLRLHPEAQSSHNPVVGMTRTAEWKGNGYWEVAKDGGSLPTVTQDLWIN